MDEFFQWQNDFKIGNFKADVQHRTLFNLAHRINDIALQKKKIVPFLEKTFLNYKIL